MSITTGTINLISTAFRDLDLELPKGYLKGLADIDADQERLTALRGRDDAALAAAVLAALKAGKDPADSDDVRRELARQQMQTALITDLVARRLDDQRTELLDQYADALLAAMAQTLAGVDAILTEARETLGAGVDLSEPTSATSVNPKDLPLWGNGRAALSKVDKLAQTWKILGSGLNRHRLDPRDLPLVVADLSASDLAALGPKPSASAAALAGHTLTLATFDTIAERKARIAGDVQAAQDAEPTFADTYRRQHGTGRVGHVFNAPA